MAKVLVALLAASFLLRSSAADANMELVLPITSFKIESRTGSGPIEVSGVQSEKGIEALTTRAFGRTYALNETQLKKLHGVKVFMLQLTYKSDSSKAGDGYLYLRLANECRLIVAQRGGIAVEGCEAVPR